ncbi:MAG: L-threonylcarbamoyladenylate synthase [Chitinophagaceae bacterium]
MLETKIGTDISYAATLLQQGEVVAIPTETVYGLAGNALDTHSIEKIYIAKQRPLFNPLILHTHSIAAIEQFAQISDATIAIAQHFIPGALTLLLPKKSIVPDLLTAGSSKVAVRIPNHHVTLALLQQLPFPLAAPSANPFGYISPVTAAHVLKGLQHQISYILDGGTCSVGVESTIIEVLPQVVMVHRVGGVAVEAIQNVTNLPVQVVKKHTSQQVQTPGQLKSHYAPHTPLYVGDINQLYEQYGKGKRVAVIALRQMYTQPNITTFTLSENGDIATAASHLFEVMHTIDGGNFDVILAETFPETGLGLAINDRLHRAQVQWK